MATKRTKRTTKRVKSLAAKKVSAKQANAVKGGGKVSHQDFQVVRSSDKATP
ncbi:MAG TPA: hypothetical protein VF376_00870 [Thermoanaerobaculia bacterium]